IMQAPGHAYAHFHLALAYHGWKNFDAAFKHHSQACQLSPQDPELLYELGNAYFGRNQLEQARQYYLRVLKIIPEHFLTL
ncbi:MAG TPA: tetratricopeptide repeat protein, partial [Crenotrichaceae bacterium]|nr:tetratricopeptide repeat protein [Crenotrichaceae bacterium]